MVDLATIKKKLPFEPTALRKARLKSGLNSSTGHDALQASVSDRKRGDDEEAAAEEEDTLALFRRAKEMAPIVEADREWRRLRQLQKHKEHEEARRRASAGRKHALSEEEDVDAAQASTPTASSALARSEDDLMDTREASDDMELVTPPPSKRSRRESTTSPIKHMGAGLSNTGEVPDSPTTRAMRSLAPDRSMTPALHGTNLQSSGASTLTYKTRSQTNQGSRVPAGSQVICLDSGSEPETPASAPLKIIDRGPPLDLDLDLGVTAVDDDDDEFADYVRKAQEQRDRHILQRERAAEAASVFSPPPATLQSAGAASSPTPEPARDITDIVITSELPGTKMCLVKFYFDRPLRRVRETWAEVQRRHGLPLDSILERDEDAVLTWRRKKVYMSSTLLSLGIRPNEDGTGVAPVDGRLGDGFSESGSRVHMQVWTPELFAEMEREEERRRRQDMSDGEGGDGEQEGAGEDEEEAVAPATLRITLKSKSGEPVRLKVLPETTAETVAAAYRAQREVPETVDVGLWFDGMRLAPDSTMEDADIDDMDTIEVHEK